MELKGKVALVSGASRGIGRAIAMMLAEAGSDVAVNYVSNKDAADKVVEEIKSIGRRAVAYQADVSKSEQTQAMIDKITDDLGVVQVDSREFVIADIPGLIEGASEGAGLGDRFLGHVERCAVLLHLVDGTQEDPAAAYRTIRGELEAYGNGLEDKPELVALNKVDALSDELRGAAHAALEAEVGRPVMMLSGVTGEGVNEALRALQVYIDDLRATEAEVEDTVPWRP